MPSTDLESILKMAVSATWMDLEVIILSEVSNKEKYKYHMMSFICEI